jgi:hypothetical protein
MNRLSKQFSHKQFLFTPGATTVGASLVHGCTSNSQSANNSQQINAIYVSSGLTSETTKANLPNNFSSLLLCQNP